MACLEGQHYSWAKAETSLVHVMLAFFKSCFCNYMELLNLHLQFLENAENFNLSNG